MRLLYGLFAALLVIAAFSFASSAQETKIKWFGHAAFSITTPKGKVLLIDPWMTNPKNPDVIAGKDPLAAVSKVDYILLTHGHRDHVGEAVEIARRTGAILIANPELAGNLVKLTDFPAKQAQTDAIMGIGGEIQIADGEVTVAMTPAIHTSSVYNAKAGPNEPERAYGGSPAGFVIVVKNGPSIYHTGDTAYFSDMALIGEQYQIDVALVNIGGHTAMEPKMAARAAKAVRAKLAIPQHFGTDEGMTPNANSFAAELRVLKVPFYEMKPGETILYRGRAMLRK
jgi:L-ascorbate metabolism protein UlaG (beta-lactamase superfamily)